MGLHANYKSNLEAAKVFEDFVYDQMYRLGVCIVRYGTLEYQRVGENRAGLEIKLDRKFRQTGNLFIETYERYNSTVDFKPAGCLSPDNSWWYAIGDYEGFYLFGKQMLARMNDHKNGNGGLHYKHVETETSKGFLLPVSDAGKYADRVINPEASTIPTTIRR